jgi:hypothetical protein
VVVVVGPHLATIFAHEVCRGISRLHTLTCCDYFQI